MPGCSSLPGLLPTPSILCRICGAALFLFSVLVFGGCFSASSDGPPPVIADLACSLRPADDALEYVGEFSFQVFDDSSVLDPDTAHVVWWVDEVPQDVLEVGSRLDGSDSLTLELSGFPRYEHFSVRLVLQDDAGSSSNELLAELFTAPGQESCEAVPED